MPTEPEPITVSEVVHRAVESCEDGTTESLDELLAKFEDDDRPIASIEDVDEMLDERIGPPEFDDLDAPFTMARAVINYLAFRRDELDVERVELLRLSARAEFDARPPQHVERWLAEQGVSL